MNAATVKKDWDHFRTVHGIALRAVAALPENALDAHPVPKMRTPKELVVHMYGMVRAFPAGVRDGILKDPDDAAAAAENRTKADLLAWCRLQWEAADVIVGRLDDAKVTGMVKTAWAGDLPGFALFRILNDEFWHHRGQFYCYLRLLGVEGPMIYDYENNEPAYQARQQAKA
jgi:uncharacterized damage-inducible protein DinB